MTREHKLALIIGFSVFMVVGVLVGDYFSKARADRLDTRLATGEPVAAPMPADVSSPLPGPVTPMETLTTAPGTPGLTLEDHFEPVEIDMQGGPLTQTDVLERAARTAADEAQAMGPAGPGRVSAPVTPPMVDDSPKYRVQARDNLYKLALKHYGSGSLWTKLRDYNRDVLKGEDKLTEGMTIRLPRPEVLLGKPAPLSGRTVTQVKQEPKFRLYKIQRDDTLGDISMKLLGTSRRFREIEKLNPGINSNALRVGTEIKVPLN